MKQNSDSIVGFTAWAAGAFDSTYVLTLSPNADGSDQPLWTAASKYSELHRPRYIALTNHYFAYSQTQSALRALNEDSCFFACKLTAIRLLCHSTPSSLWICLQMCIEWKKCTLSSVFCWRTTGYSPPMRMTFYLPAWLNAQESRKYASEGVRIW